MVERIIELSKNDDGQTQDNFDDDDDDHELSYHHRVPSILDELDWNDITEVIDQMDAKPGMSFLERELARLHKHTILSMRRQLTQKKQVMRASYKGYSFHTYARKEFEEKSSNYIKNTGIYTYIDGVDPKNPEASQRCLKNIVQQVDTTLQDLLHSKSISDRHYVVMHPKRSIVRLNYLHFVPDREQEGEPLQPIVICNNGSTAHMARYLSGILWSMFNQVTGCKTFKKNTELVDALEHYHRQGHLRETTHFVTFNINEICTKFSHDIAIKALDKFLGVHRAELETVVEGLTNETIIQLVHLVLRNQFFIYQNKLYQQIHGSASGSFLTRPLACIYLFYGQSSAFVDSLVKNSDQLLTRCRDDFFLTWNDSKDHFLTLFNATIANEQQQPRLQAPMVIIGSTVHLLDLEVGHHQGKLRTTIYHHPESDEDELPNKFEYHTCEPSKLLQAALKRAVRCCSTETDFHREVRYMRNAHLLRGFSPAFVKQSTQDFFMQFDVGEMRDGAMTVPYDKLRQRVFEHDRQQAERNREHENQKRNIIRIPYPNHLDQQVAVDMKNDILHILREGMSNREAVDDLQFEWVPRPQTPLTINDYLVDKRPLLRLLTLPGSLERA